jgi:RNA polymerase sigma-70 factor (ECF subfamily)
VDKLHSQAAKEGTTQEFEALFQEHWTRVYGVVYRIIGDPDEAQDIALETFLKMHRKMTASGGLLSFSRPASWISWLYRVATNLGLNALRSKKRREKYEFESGRIFLKNRRSGDPAVEVERDEDRRKVRKVLSKMKPRSAKILLLRHSGFTYAEIARVIKVSPNSVGKLLSRAEADFERRYRALEGSL